MTHSRFVGKVENWEFTNLVIDNYFFGVSAVAQDGSETPVVSQDPPAGFNPPDQFMVLVILKFETLPKTLPFRRQFSIQV